MSDGLTTRKLIVTYDDTRAREIGAELSGVYDRRTYGCIRRKDLLFYQADVSGGDLVTRSGCSVLRAAARKASGYDRNDDVRIDGCRRLPLSGIVSGILHFDKKSTVDERKLSAQLVEMGYEKSPQVEEPGQFSIRGGIIDIFDMTEENPYRIELWGDERRVDSKL